MWLRCNVRYIWKAGSKDFGPSVHAIIKRIMRMVNMMKHVSQVRRRGKLPFLEITVRNGDALFMFFFRVSRLSVHNDGLSVLRKEINQVGVL